MDMLLAILSVVVFVTWCVFKADLQEASKLTKEMEPPPEPRRNWQKEDGCGM